MKKLMGILIVFLIPSFCLASDFSKTDKYLFTSVCVLQIIDGLTTADGQKSGRSISDTWAWKYGTNRPAAEVMWGIKAVELGGAYVVGRALPAKYRKGFFIAVDSLLLFCIQHNLQIGAGFSISY